MRSLIRVQLNPIAIATLFALVALPIATAGCGPDASGERVEGTHQSLIGGFEFSGGTRAEAPFVTPTHPLTAAHGAQTPYRRGPIPSPFPPPPPSETTPILATDVHVGPCATSAAPIVQGVSTFATGGGKLAYVKEGKVYVLPALEGSPVQVGSVAPYQFAVDDAYVLLELGTKNQKLVSVDLATGATVTLSQAYWIGAPTLIAHQAFWWTTDDTSTWTLWSARADGRASATRITTQAIDTNLYVHDDTLSWQDDAHALWTMPAGGGAPTAQARLTEWAPMAFDDTTLYYGRRGTPAPGNRFTPFSIVSEPLAGGDITTIAESLPANYPSRGTEWNGTTSPILGQKRLFWAEGWANAELTNWSLRAAPRGGEATPQVVDSYQRTAGAATPGTLPKLAADGVAVYWTHEGTLMRLCE
jgi:hypothetical protein